METLKQLYKSVAPWEDSEPAEIPTMEAKDGSDLVGGYKWTHIKPAVQFDALPVELRVLCVFATMVADMSLKVALTMKQKVADDLGKKWTEYGFQKTMSGARISEKWANIGQTIAMACQFILPYGVGLLKPIQDRIGDIRPHNFPIARVQGWIDYAATNIPEINGKHLQDLRASIKNVGPGISQYAGQQGQIAAQESGAGNQLGQFWAQKQERDNQQASGFKQEVSQQQQSAFQTSVDYITKRGQLAERTVSANA